MMRSPKQGSWRRQDSNKPTPETYCEWKTFGGEDIRAANGRPDEAWIWIMEVWYDRENKASKSSRTPGRSSHWTPRFSQRSRAPVKTGVSSPRRRVQRRGKARVAGKCLLMVDQHSKTSGEAGNLHWLSQWRDKRPEAFPERMGPRDRG